ncbi:ABC transporter substrate-binding protein [Labrys neptuniae]
MVMIAEFYRTEPQAAVTGMVARVRMTLLLLGSLILAAMSLVSVAQAEIRLTDAAGREVRLQQPAKRIVTNDSLVLLSLALVDPQPISKLAGWAAPQRFDRGLYDAFRRRFPEIDNTAVVGAVSPANSSVEAILGAQPDLFVVSIWQPDWDAIAAKLEAAGVPVIFLDSPRNSRRAGEATIASIRLLGRAIGQDTRAEAFAAFLKARYDAIAQRLRGEKTKPRGTWPQVLVDAHAGLQCCSAPGADNPITHDLAFAGGRVLGADIIPGYDGQLSPEYVLAADPKVYVGTGGSHLAKRGGLVLGAGIEPEAARTSLRAVVQRNLLGELSAVREGRAYGLSHQVAISALNILAVECLAKWTHPELFADLDPAQTLAEINRRFLAAPIEGTFWIDAGRVTGPSAP